MQMSEVSSPIFGKKRRYDRLAQLDIHDLRPNSLNQILQSSLEIDGCNAVVKSEYEVLHKQFQFNERQQLQIPTNDDNNNIDSNQHNNVAVAAAVSNDDDGDDKSNHNDTNQHCNNIQLIIANDINQQQQQQQQRNCEGRDEGRYEHLMGDHEHDVSIYTVVSRIWGWKKVSFHDLDYPDTILASSTHMMDADQIRKLNHYILHSSEQIAIMQPECKPTTYS
jgi:hypothetical protein